MYCSEGGVQLGAGSQVRALTTGALVREERRVAWVPKGLGMMTELSLVVLSALWVLLGREADTRDTPGGMVG